MMFVRLWLEGYSYRGRFVIAVVVVVVVDGMVVATDSVAMTFEIVLHRGVHAIGVLVVEGWWYVYVAWVVALGL